MPLCIPTDCEMVPVPQSTHGLLLTLEPYLIHPAQEDPIDENVSATAGNLDTEAFGFFAIDVRLHLLPFRCRR